MSLEEFLGSKCDVDRDSNLYGGYVLDYEVMAIAYEKVKERRDSTIRKYLGLVSYAIIKAYLPQMNVTLTSSKEKKLKPFSREN